ncbi:Wzz/FepE/Etk N-terminal domain-containing protein [Solibacillus sp.]|uniref:YveK family protein n=1 Tax=Solibacillus sp. TaxID=1909654 RepID=UPI003315B3E3
MEETISLQEIFKTLKKRMPLILLCTFGAALIAAIISFFLMTPIYQASTQVLVNQKKDTVAQQQVTTADIQSNLQLINTYNEIITSPAILTVVSENLDMGLSAAQLKEKIAVSNANNSQVLNISVQDETYNIAVDIANEVVEVFKEKIPSLMNVDNVNVLSPAEPMEDASPIKPSKLLNVAIGLVLGLMVGVGLAFLLEFLDTTVKTEDDVEQLLNLPIIGLVSPISDSEFAETISSQRRSPREAVRKAEV